MSHQADLIKATRVEALDGKVRCNWAHDRLITAITGPCDDYTPPREVRVGETFRANGQANPISVILGDRITKDLPTLGLKAGDFAYTAAESAARIGFTMSSVLVTFAAFGDIRGRGGSAFGLTSLNTRPAEEKMEAKDLLLADLEHFGQSMWRNEEAGEKRFSFFVSLVTAVAAGLVALRASKEVSDGFILNAAAIATTALFFLGLLSYLRMIHRNRTTDEYQQTLKYTRAMYVAACPELKLYQVPRRIETWGGKWLREAMPRPS